MGGESEYGSSLGFGTRNGFVEHYWYQLPDVTNGQHFHASWDRDYLVSNATLGHLLHRAHTGLDPSPSGLQPALLPTPLLLTRRSTA